MTGTQTPLSGGNMSSGVVRSGDTVRRPAGPWTPAVHALLAHLHDVGFRGAPRPLGIDERGREVLPFIPGTPAWPAQFHLLNLVIGSRQWALTAETGAAGRLVGRARHQPGGVSRNTGVRDPFTASRPRSWRLRRPHSARRFRRRGC